MLDEVRHFFEQPQFVNHRDEIEDYVRWALLPDGPAFQQIPTPITCKVERGRDSYIVSFILSQKLARIPQFIFQQPAGTFLPPFKVAKHFLPQAKGSVLEPAICAAHLYALLLVSVGILFLL